MRETCKLRKQGSNTEIIGHGLPITPIGTVCVVSRTDSKQTAGPPQDTLGPRERKGGRFLRGERNFSVPFPSEHYLRSHRKYNYFVYRENM